MGQLEKLKGAEHRRHPSGRDYYYISKHQSGSSLHFFQESYLLSI